MRISIPTALLGLLIPTLANGTPPDTAPAGSPEPVADMVDPRIGTVGGGNTFIGPTRPWGLVKLGPDMEGPDLNSGYAADRSLQGFSHLHVSGTGGGPKYGNILLVPTTGDLAVADYASPWSDEKVALGYYAVTLDRYAVRAELTAARRVGIHRYTFKEGGPAHVLIDVGHMLTSSHHHETQRFEGGEVTIVSPTEVRGTGRYSGGWNKGREYRVHFCAQFDTAATSSGTWTTPVPLPESTTNTTGVDGQIGAYLGFDTHPGQAVRVKVGISFLDAATACASIAAEAPSWDVDQLRSEVVSDWEHALASVRVEGGTQDERVMFYTALYHAMLMPADRTGENPKWTSDEPYYDDFYAVWDTFRTTNPLLTLVAPEREALIVRAMIDIAKHDGYLPDGRSGNDNGRTQGGSNGQIVVAEAILKDLPGIDTEAAFAAMTKDSEVPPFDPQKEGRGGLADYNTKGYVSLAFERSASRTLEYSHDDWAVAQAAHRLFKMNERVRYTNRAKGWQRLWDGSGEAEGVHGFIRPRQPDGSWLTPFDVTAAGSWPDPFYESDSWEYSLYVPHDVRRLIELCGGPEPFVERLDTLFDGGHFHIGNEPAFHIPTLYIWAGRHDRTVERVERIRAEAFKARPDGLPGNDDSGALSAWFAFQAMGLYPNPGHDYYLITTPLFPQTTIRLTKDQTFTIAAPDLDPARHNIYIKGATLNGRRLDRAWLRHEWIRHGGRLVLEMTDSPGKWPSRKAAPPPSMSDE